MVSLPMSSPARSETESLFDLNAQRHSTVPLWQRIGIYRDGPVYSWSDHFSSLTKEYATLQVERLGVPEALGALANEAQLNHLVMAFIEDRRVDGQIRLSPEEAAFEAELRRCCVEQLEAVLADSEPGRYWVDRLRAGYMEANRNEYGVVSSDGLRPYPGLRRIVAGRGYLGALVPMALAARAGANGASLRRLYVAFACLMLGLQWLDDLVDWREDLAHGDRNLMLELLRLRGWDAYAHPANRLRDPNVGFALLESGAISDARRHAMRWLGHAARRHETLGNETLARLIRDRARLAEASWRRERARIESTVLAGVGGV